MKVLLVLIVLAAVVVVLYSTTNAFGSFPANPPTPCPIQGGCL